MEKMSLIINNNEEQRFGYLVATEVTEQWTNFLWFVTRNKAIFTNQNHYHFQRNKTVRFLLSNSSF